MCGALNARLTVRQAAVVLGVSASTIRNWASMKLIVEVDRCRVDGRWVRRYRYGDLLEVELATRNRDTRKRRIPGGRT